MLILIDGYNVIAPVAAPGRGATDRWLQTARQKLISQLVTGLGELLAGQTTVVFDAGTAPPGFASQYVDHGLQIDFAVGYRDADDRIEELISQHSSPKRLTVVSSDHRLQTAARRRGAMAVDSELWLDRLTSGRLLLAVPLTSSDPVSDSDSEKPTTAVDTDSWLEAFGISGELPPKTSVQNPFPPRYGEDLL